MSRTYHGGESDALEDAAARTYPLRASTSVRRQRSKGDSVEHQYGAGGGGYSARGVDQQRSVDSQWASYKDKRGDDADATQAIDGYLTKIENQVFDIPAVAGQRKAW
jgi:hypothetical protein